MSRLTIDDIRWANADPLVLKDEQDNLAAGYLDSKAGRTAFFNEIRLQLLSQRRRMRPNLVPDRQFLFVAMTANQRNVLAPIYERLDGDATLFERGALNFEIVPALAAFFNFLMLLPKLILDCELLFRYPKLLFGSIYYYHFIRALILRLRPQGVVCANLSSFDGKLCMLAAKELGKTVYFVPHALLAEDPSLSAKYIDCAFVGNELERQLLISMGMPSSDVYVDGHLFVDFPQVQAQQAGVTLVCTNALFSIEENATLFRDLIASGRELRLRFHPAEDRTRYESLLEGLNYAEANGSLTLELSMAEELLLSYSSVVYVAHLLGRKLRILERWPNRDSYGFRNLLSRPSDDTGFDADKRSLVVKIESLVANMLAFKDRQKKMA